VRLYESLGQRARTAVRANFEVTQVTETDLLERPLPDGERRESYDGPVELAFRSFQIRTLRFGRRQAGKAVAR
jgi:alpha-mannosidase